jgi:DNA-binding transcriptional ArsR family regulator
MLAHPLRIRLLFEYQGDPTCPSDVARRMGEPLNLVSYHTTVLSRHGLIERVGTEKRRGGTAHFYRSTTAQSLEGDEWLATPLPLRRALMRGLLAATTERARGALLEGGFDEVHAHLSSVPLVLDDAGVRRVAAILRRALDEIIGAQEASDRRAPATRRTYEVVLMGFESTHELAR